MKKNVAIAILLVLLIIAYGLIYRSTVRLQSKVVNLKTELETLIIEAENQEHLFLYLSRPDRIEKLARDKYKMKEPDDFMIIEIRNEE
jgi:cell division protein FtsB